MESSSGDTHDINDATSCPQQRRLFVHIRPLTSHEINRRSRCIIDSDRTTSTTVVLLDENNDEDSANHALECDGVFQESFSPDQMHLAIASVNESTIPHQLLSGYNCTLVSYGTVATNPSLEKVTKTTTNDLQHQLIQDIFQSLRDRCAQQPHLQCSVQCSILEIMLVNGRLRMRDLIHPPTPIVGGFATTVSCICAQDVWHWVQRASTLRYFRPPISSNTLVVQLQLQLYDPAASQLDNQIIRSRLQMVDVMDTCERSTDDTTRLLHALGSDAHTTVLCTISPSALSWKEAVHTLQIGRAWMQSFTHQTSIQRNMPAVNASVPMAHAQMMDILMTSAEIKECDQLRADFSILQSQCSELQENESKSQTEITKLRHEIQALQQRKSEVDYQLRVCQFRENEAVVFLRQIRRFYFRLLQKIALEASGNATAKKKTTTSDHLRSLLERIPGAPDSVQLMDLDQLMVESGLLEPSEIGEDIVSLDLPASALQRSAQQVDLMTEKQNVIEQASAGEVEPAMSAAIPLALSSDPATSIVSTRSTDESYRHPNQESPDIVEARQKIYQTPAGRCISLREKLLEEELLLMTELNHQLRQCLTKEQCSVEALTDKLGIEVAFDRMRHAQEVRRAHDALERKSNDLKAVIWKMNELHMVGKTLNTQVQNRDQHILYLEEKLISLQNQNDTVLMSHQATEQQMRHELLTTQSQLSTFTTPIWHLFDDAQSKVSMPSRIHVPFHSRGDGELNHDDSYMAEIDQWITASCEVPLPQEKDDSKFIEVGTQTEVDDDVMAFFYTSQNITEDTLDNLLFMDSPIDRSIQRSIEISSSIIADSNGIDAQSTNVAETLRPAPIYQSQQSPASVDNSFQKPTKDLSLLNLANGHQSSSSQSQTNLAATPSIFSDEISAEPSACDVKVEHSQVVEIPMMSEMTSHFANSTLSPLPMVHPSKIADVPNSYENPISLGINPVVVEVAADLVEPSSPIRPLINKSKSESPTRVTRKSPGPKKLSSFLDRLQKQTQRKLDSDEQTTTPEFLKMFNRIGSKNKNETVLETAGAAPARDATRTSFEQLRLGSVSTPASRIGPDITTSSSSLKKWTPRKPKREDSDSDDSFAKAFMSGAQIAGPSSQQQLATKTESNNDEGSAIKVDDDNSDSDDSFARSFMKGAQIASSSSVMPNPVSQMKLDASECSDKSEIDSSESSADDSSVVERKWISRKDKKNNGNCDSDSDDSSDQDSMNGNKNILAQKEPSQPLNKGIQENPSLKTGFVKHETSGISNADAFVSDPSSNGIATKDSILQNSSMKSNVSSTQKQYTSDSDESSDGSLESRVQTSCAVNPPVCRSVGQGKSNVTNPVKEQMERTIQDDSDSDSSSEDEASVLSTKLVPSRAALTDSVDNHMARSIENNSDSDSSSDDETSFLSTKKASTPAPTLSGNSDSDSNSDSDDVIGSGIPTAPPMAKRQQNDSEDSDTDDDGSILRKTPAGGKPLIGAPTLGSGDILETSEKNNQHSAQASAVLKRIGQNESNKSDSSECSDEESKTSVNSMEERKINQQRMNRNSDSDKSDSDDESSSSESQTGIPQKPAHLGMRTTAQKKKDESSSDSSSSSSRFEPRKKDIKAEFSASKTEKTLLEESVSSSKMGRKVVKEKQSTERKLQNEQKIKSTTDAHGSSGLSCASKSNKLGDDKSTKSGRSKARSTKSQSKEKSPPAFVIQDGKLVKKGAGDSSEKISKPAFSIVNGKLVKTAGNSVGKSKAKTKKKQTI